MDIQMDGKDGFQTSKELKRQYHNEFPSIVFVTVLREYAPMGYGLGAWDKSIIAKSDDNQFVQTITHMDALC
jgi:CheY-like chemotaxis protein